MTTADGQWRFEIGIVALVAAYSVVIGLLLPDWAYVPANLAATAAVMFLAIRHGFTRQELGLEGSEVGSGLRWGSGSGLLIVIAVVVAASIPAFRDYFADGRFLGTSAGLASYHLLIRIPIGTVVFEEVLFRSVLLGMFLRRMGTVAAVVWSSVLFGLWHIIPTLNGLKTNELGDQVDSAIATTATVAGAVAVTFAAGIAFSWLRLRSRSIVAPMMAHLAVNASAYLVGYLIVRNGWS
jgi:membrane protease YdiL (CAAX protease family)